METFDGKLRKKVNEIFKNDFHVHTYYSVCAREKSKATPFCMLERAQNLGMETVGFTDHFAQHSPYATPKWADCGTEMIAALRRDVEDIHIPVRVLIGCEADVINGNTLSIERDYARELDYVMVSASHFHLPGIKQPESRKASAVARHYVAMLQTALAFDFVSVIAHPFLTPFNALGPIEEYMSKIPDEALYAISRKAKQQRIAMEINAQLGRDSEYLHATERFFGICKEVGVRFTYGSDAHHVKNLGPYPGIKQAIRYLALQPKDFLTTEELLYRTW